MRDLENNLQMSLLVIISRLKHSFCYQNPNPTRRVEKLRKIKTVFALKNDSFKPGLKNVISLEKDSNIINFEL